MATKDMAMILGGRVLPKPSSFLKIIQPNETDNVTLGGNLYTDFMNYRRAWQVGWKNIKEEDMSLIETLFQEQYELAIYHTLQFDAYDLYVPVKMEVSNQNIRYNGSLIENFNIVLKEQFAIS